MSDAHASLLIAAVAWTDKATAIGTMVAAIGFVAAAAGAWFAFDQIRESRRDRLVQLIAGYGSRWDDHRLTEARAVQRNYFNDELAEAADDYFGAGFRSGRRPRTVRVPRVFMRLQPDVDVPILLRVPNYFEDLAIMVDCGRFDLEVVERSFSGLVLVEWDFWELAIHRIRKYDPESYIEFENLAERLRNLERLRDRRRRREVLRKRWW